MLPRFKTNKLPYHIAKLPEGLRGVPLPVIWEITRAALHCEVDLACFNIRCEKSWINRDQDRLWTALEHHPAFRGKRLPEKSDPETWRSLILDDIDFEFTSVILSATVEFSKEKPPACLGRLKLHPLKRDKSCRLHRRFGSERFLELHFPKSKAWYEILSKSKNTQSLDEISRGLASWLSSQRHCFLGRQWKSFWITPHKKKTTTASSLVPEQDSVYMEKVYLFAESGDHFIRKAHPLAVPPRGEPVSPRSDCTRTECTRIAMLNWLLNFEENTTEEYLKLFSRIKLGK